MRYANGVMANTRLKQRILFKHKNTMFFFTCKKWKGDRGEKGSAAVTSLPKSAVFPFKQSPEGEGNSGSC